MFFYPHYFHATENSNRSRSRRPLSDRGQLPSFVLLSAVVATVTHCHCHNGGTSRQPSNDDPSDGNKSRYHGNGKCLPRCQCKYEMNRGGHDWIELGMIGLDWIRLDCTAIGLLFPLTMSISFILSCVLVRDYVEFLPQQSTRIVS